MSKRFAPHLAALACCTVLASSGAVLAQGVIPYFRFLGLQKLEPGPGPTPSGNGGGGTTVDQGSSGTGGGTGGGSTGGATGGGGTAGTGGGASGTGGTAGTGGTGGTAAGGTGGTSGGSGTGTPDAGTNTNSMALASPGTARARTASPFRLSIPVSGASGPVTWANAGDPLPGGLSLGQDGTISGIPSTASRSGSIVVTAFDSIGQSAATAPFAIDVRPPPGIVVPNPLAAEVGTALSVLPATTDAYGAQTWRIASGTMPPGLSVSTSTGAITGTPTQQGSFGGISLAVRDGDGVEGTSAPFTVAVGAGPTLSYPTLTIDKGPTYVLSPQSNGLTPPLTFAMGSQSGSPNCTGPDAQGALTCTQSSGDGASGTYTVTATDARGRTAGSGPVTVTNGAGQGFALGQPGSTSYARSGTPFEGTPPGAVNAPGSVTYAALDPLPSGFALNPSTGALSSASVPAGTPASRFRVAGTTASGPLSQTAVATYALAVSPPPTVSAPTGSGTSLQGSPFSVSGSLGNMFGANGSPAVTATGLPTGLTVSASGSTYTISGIPTEAGTFPVTVTATDPADGAKGTAQTTLTIGGATATADSTGASIVEGDAASFHVTTNLPNPTWTLTGGPAWLTSSATGSTLTVSGTSGATPGGASYQVVATATGNGVSKSATVPVSVAAATASATNPGPVRPGGTFSVPVSTSMKAPGTWSSAGIGGAGGVAFADGSAHATTATGVAPANAGTSPVTRTFDAAYTASSASAGSPARSVVSPSVTVYPALSVASGSNATFTAGSAFSLPAPQIGGGYGTQSWSIWSGGQDITSTFGQTFPGLSFDRASGRIAGLATKGASATLTYRVHDDGQGSTAMAADAASAPFTLSGGDATASASQPQPTLSAGGALDSTVTTSLDSPTWTVAGAPAWMTATPNGNSLRLTGTAPPLSQPEDDLVTVTAANASASTITKIPVHVNAVSGSLSAVATRTGRSFTTLLTTNYPAGKWAMQPIDVNFSNYANGAFAGTALGNPGPGVVSRTMTAVLSGGGGTIAQATAPLTIYPDLAVVAPSAQTGVTGTFSSFAAPQVVGQMGSLAWRLFVDGGSEVTSSLGSICQGLSFDGSGNIAGTPTAPCAVNLRYVVADTVASSPDLNESTPSAAFTLSVANPRVSIVATPGNSVTEGDGITLEAGSNIRGRTFSAPGAPAWLQFRVRDSDGAYVASGATPDVSADTTFPVTVYATSGSTSSNNTINITVKAATATISAIGPQRVGQAFQATVTESMAAPGAWSASSPTNDVGFSGVSNGILSGAAPASVGNSAVTRTLTAAYTASVPSASGSAAQASASTSFTVYPALAFASAPAAQYGAVGTQLNAISPPAVYGRAGTLRYALSANGADVSSNLGGTCPGLSFSTSTGQITGKPTSACTPTLAWTVSDDGGNVQNLVASAGSGSFQLTVTNSIPNAFSFPASGNVAGGQLASSQPVTLSGMTAPGPVSVQGTGGYAVYLGVNGGALSSTIPASVPANATLVVGLSSYPGTNGGSRTATVNVSGVTATWTATTVDTTPDAFGWNNQTGQQPNAYVGSNTITVTGLTAPAPLTISGYNSPGVSINGATWNTAKNQTVNNGDTIAVALQAASTASTWTTATITIGGVSGTFSVATGTDNPNPFNCSSGTNSVYPATGGQEYYCDVYLTGMQVPGAWSVSGQYNRVYTDATGWTTASSGSVPANGRIVLAVLAPAGTNGGTNVGTMRVGNQQQTLTVRTGDTYPDDFNFPNLTNLPLSTFVGSATVTITGVDQPTPVQTTNNGYVSINGGGWTQSGTVYNGQTLALAMTTSGSYDTSVGMSVLVGGSGGVLKNWLTTTGSVPCDGTGNSAQNQAMYYHYAPDVQQAGDPAIIHWIRYGYFEGRRSCYQTPHCGGYGDTTDDDANRALYYWFNPDVQAAGMDAYTHWQNYGMREGRIACYLNAQGR